jgi:uncharacterized protein (TIGR02757 family)
MHPLKKTLDQFYRDYDFSERIKHDPIEFPHRYSAPGDIEIAGFIACSFAYGKVELFKSVIEKILVPGGDNPSQFIKNFSLKSDGKYFRGISYRFNQERDILCLLYLLSQTLQKWDSLKNLFNHYYRHEHEDVGPALAGCVNYFMGLDTSQVYGKNIKPSGLTQFFPSPEKGSACKRLNLFLRWMIRTKDIDLGIWNNILPSKLIIPLDTHIARISRCLGLTKRASSDWKTAKDITEALKKFDPRDPLKYDFALCHKGISGLCKGKKLKDVCLACSFFS